MTTIFNKLIDSISDIFKLYIKTRFIRNPGSATLSSGLFIIGLLLSNSYAAKVGINLGWFQAEAKVSTQSTPPAWEFALYVLAMLLIISGVIWLFHSSSKLSKRDEQEHERRLVLCVQFDAYNEVIPALLTAAVPAEIIGKRIPILIQKRDALVGGIGVENVANEVMHIKTSLLQNAGGRDLNDISVCVGGLAPVPFLFILGNVLEDDRPISWAEWQRNSCKWLWSKDGKPVPTWKIPALDSIKADEVVLQSGITYPIAVEDVSKAFPDTNVVIWEPTEKLFQLVLDETSCTAICDEFKKLMRQLSLKGVKRVHFLLACSTALTMRLGSQK